MGYLLLGAVFFLAFSNGANDNFKGVATLWGARRAGYHIALAWATVFTALGSFAAFSVSNGLVAIFNGSKLVPLTVASDAQFITAVALAAALTVFVAGRIGAPISTTHAIAGALVGTGLLAVGWHGVRYAILLHSVALPLLLSPLLAMAGTLALFPLAERLIRSRDCICLIETPTPVLVNSSGGTGPLATFLRQVGVRWSHSQECMIGTELVRARISEGLHWFSAASISLARGLNDTPKIVALVAVLGPLAPGMCYGAVALAMALGGIVGARRVADTISRRITPFDPPQALSANFLTAVLVGLASLLGLPVSTTHVAVGSVLGVGLHRRKDANWRKAREIAGAWLITLPMAAAIGAAIYWILRR